MYNLYYWSHIQGRGEFIRLALEAAGAEYVDVVRQSEKKGGGRAAVLAILQGTDPRAPFAPPILEVDGEWISQTANILAFLGPRLGLVPRDAASRRWANQLQLVVADFVVEARCPEDGMVEAVRKRGPGYVAAVQWHPEFHDVNDPAFPKAMARLEPEHPNLVALHARVAKLPRVARYLKSKRRIPFNQSGIFRHYPELDR